MVRLMLALLLLALSVRPAAAERPQPIDALRGPVQSVLDILQDPRYHAEGEKGAQRQRLWEIVRAMFDFSAISERAVGRNWARFTPEQKQAFTDAFSTLLGETYLTKIQSGYTNEKVEFVNQELLSDAKARVKTKIVREVDAIVVDYSLRPDGNSWRIYDVNVEGVSLVQNYRSQFDQILSKDSPDVLIERLRTKNKAQEKK